MIDAGPHSPGGPARLSRALADEGRLALLSTLQGGEKSVRRAGGGDGPVPAERLAAPREPDPRGARGGAARRKPGLLPGGSPTPTVMRICDAVCNSLVARAGRRSGSRSRPGGLAGWEVRDEGDERRPRARPRGGAGRSPVASAEDVPVTLAEALALAGQANPELQAAVRAGAQAARAEAVRRMRGRAWT